MRPTGCSTGEGRSKARSYSGDRKSPRKRRRNALNAYEKSQPLGGAHLSNGAKKAGRRGKFRPKRRPSAQETRGKMRGHEKSK